MEILFESAKLQKLCESRKEMQRVLGADCARKLRTRLADLLAADTVAELEAGKPHPLKSDRAGQFALSLQGGMRLVFEPADEPIPRSDNGAIDWAQVTKVRVVLIGDYHDD